MDTSKFKFCPFCGHAPLVREPGHEGAKCCARCEKVLFPAPHPTVSALVVDPGEQHVLLTRRGVEPFKGQWDTPGGFLEPGESLEDGLRRELREELGVEVRIVRFLGSYPDVYGPDATPVIAVFYVATVDQGSPVPGSDVSECKWFHKDDVPAVAFEDGRRALEEWRRETERCGEDHWRTRDE